jgi:hypothetical protein
MIFSKSSSDCKRILTHLAPDGRPLAVRDEPEGHGWVAAGDRNR